MMGRSIQLPSLASPHPPFPPMTISRAETMATHSSERGLRQGFPLSLLLFLLVMEGLSRLIALAKREGRLQGLNISDKCILTCLLFVDDVLIFLNGGIRGTTAFYDILLLFSSAIGMEPN